MTTYKPKLIEIALPLTAINTASAREKSIPHAHPSSLHVWWARRPLAAARAVIWASLVDDPSGDPLLSPEQQEVERQRLFGILERLVMWENLNDPRVLDEARAEIDRCFPDGPPAIIDPFGGGGAIPLEAQRLGLHAITGDLNPVAVLIQRAMLEIPPRFADLQPVHPSAQSELGSRTGAQGLACDIEEYGRWMRDEALRRIGHHYPDAKGQNGETLTPSAWIWARTVESPDPSWHGHVPLVASWVLERKPGRPTVWIEPIIDASTQSITYEIRSGGAPTHERTARGATAKCIATGATIDNEYLRDQLTRCQGSHLLAILAEGRSGRVYLPPSRSAQKAADEVPKPSWYPEGHLPEAALGFRVQRYGLDEWWKLFTPRQLLALATFSDLIGEAREHCRQHAAAAGMNDDGARLRDGGSGADAYADAVATYLAFCVDKSLNSWSSLATWSIHGFVSGVFKMQTVPMTWDFVEVNPFSSTTGSWMSMVDWVRKAVERLPAIGDASVAQRDARARVRDSPSAVVSTDPPYYDNIGYADLADYFFVWLRRNLADIWPDECATLLSPKADQLIADPARHGGRSGAEKHFELGIAEFMAEVATTQIPDVPATIYYAYKATESKNGEIHSTGWDTFLQAVIDAQLQVTATWPMRTERPGRPRGIGANALASSIVLACRPRLMTAPLATRGEFVTALRSELPEAVRILQSGNIAPVDLPQSTIGPGIGVFSRFSRVVESDGSAMSVSSALSIINDVLGEVLDGEESEMDADSRFALTWYTQFGYDESSSGDADSVARAKNTTLGGVVEAGIGETRGGQFRLFERAELDDGWSPTDDTRLTVWEATQHLVSALEQSESNAAEILHRLGGYGERARVLAYLLFKKATDKGWADEALSYNGLITAWPALQAIDVGGSGQQTLL